MIELSHCIFQILFEASILNLPAITIRQTHERPEGMDEGILIMSGLKVSNVLDSIKITIDLFKRKIKMNSVHDYNSENQFIKMIPKNIPLSSFII